MLVREVKINQQPGSENKRFKKNRCEQESDLLPTINVDLKPIKPQICVAYKSNITSRASDDANHCWKWILKKK